MLKLTFYISEYEDGNVSIEPHHMHYCFRDELCFDDVPADGIYRIMQYLRTTLEDEDLIPVFQLL